MSLAAIFTQYIFMVKNILSITLRVMIGDQSLVSYIDKKCQLGLQTTKSCPHMVCYEIRW